jgi:hypothetical protein
VLVRRTLDEKPPAFEPFVGGPPADDRAFDVCVPNIRFAGNGYFGD